VGQGKTVNDPGNSYQSLGQYEKTMELFEKDLTISKDLDDLVEKDTTINGLDNYYVTRSVNCCFL
jgi:tetratricopeptide (TPR) repeat protein